MRNHLPRLMAIALALASGAGHAQSFVVFDATLYSAKPDLRSRGLVGLPVVYSEKGWWPKDRMALPPRQAFEDRLGRLINRPPWDQDVLICIDIEEWRTQDAGERPRSIANLREVLRWARARASAPRYRFGYYSLLPAPAYYEALRPDGSAEKVAWQQANDDLKPLAQEVDAIFPSLYTFSSDREEWRTAAVAILREARRYGKPVYPFIWPQYHMSAGFWRAHQPIELDLWRLQLETAREHADGVVIWGGYDFEADGAARWDDNAGWWRVTEEVLREWNIPPPPAKDAR